MDTLELGVVLSVVFWLGLLLLLCVKSAQFIMYWYIYRKCVYDLANADIYTPPFFSDDFTKYAKMAAWVPFLNKWILNKTSDKFYRKYNG